MVSPVRCISWVLVAAALIRPSFAQPAPEVPRAWLVSKGNVQAVLVGESHVGTPLEYDPYFDTVVRPSYLVAEAAVMETYFGPKQWANAAWELGRPCAEDPAGLHSERVRLGFREVISATRDNKLAVPNWMESWEAIPDYLFYSLLLDSFTVQALGSRYDRAIEAQGGPGVSLRLRAEGIGAKEITGLDTAKGVRTNFCTAKTADRADLLADQLFKVSRLLRLKLSDPSYLSFGRLAAAGGHVVEEMLHCVDLSTPCSIEQTSDNVRLLEEKGWMWKYSQGAFEITIKKRTNSWVPVIVKTLSEHRRSFVIVGAMHLPDLKVGNRVEPGLISLLRRQGYSVTRIDNAGEISATFLSPSWFDRIRAAWENLWRGTLW
jgi:hypothetical protein